MARWGEDLSKWAASGSKQQLFSSACLSFLHGPCLSSLQVWAGSPAKFLRNLEPEEKEFIAKSASFYSELADVHRCECRPGHFRSVRTVHCSESPPNHCLSCVHAVENSKTFEELVVESRIEVDRYQASDPLNTIHQMYELDAQTLLATKSKK